MHVLGTCVCHQKVADPTKRRAVNPGCARLQTTREYHYIGLKVVSDNALGAGVCQSNIT